MRSLWLRTCIVSLLVFTLNPVSSADTFIHRTTNETLHGYATGTADSNDRIATVIVVFMSDLSIRGTLPGYADSMIRNR